MHLIHPSALQRPIPIGPAGIIFVSAIVATTGNAPRSHPVAGTLMPTSAEMTLSRLR